MDSRRKAFISVGENFTIPRLGGVTNLLHVMLGSDPFTSIPSCTLLFAE